MKLFQSPNNIYHLSTDGKTSVCGQDCSHWFREFQPALFAKNDRDRCKRCGTLEDFQTATEELKIRQMLIDAESAKREAAASALRIDREHKKTNLVNQLLPILSETGIDPVIMPNNRNSARLVYTVPIGSDSFEIEVIVKAPETFWTPAENDIEWQKSNGLR
jgi:hypothetical protein